MICTGSHIHLPSDIYLRCRDMTFIDSYPILVFVEVCLCWITLHTIWVPGSNVCSLPNCWFKLLMQLFIDRSTHQISLWWWSHSFVHIHLLIPQDCATQSPMNPACLRLANDDAMFYGWGAACFKGIFEVIDPTGKKRMHIRIGVKVNEIKTCWRWYTDWTIFVLSSFFKKRAKFLMMARWENL